MELQDLIDSIDIVEYISRFVDLEEKNGEFWGLSPFKDEKTPSFSIRQNPPVFFDYSSGIGGNVFTFTRYYYNCSKAEAVDILKKYAGCEGEIFSKRNKMQAIITLRKYKGQKAAKKVNKSKILSTDYMQRYEKNPSKLAVWESEGISKASLEKFQVYYDGFSDRLVYPIRDIEGNIVNVGGRTLDPNWKEKGQRKYCYFFQWGSMNTVYGIAENMKSILEKREVILFEGCKSVLLADSWGITNTGAILTSHLSANQLKILAKLGCRVVFALDKDVKIREDHNIQKLKRYVNVEYLYDFEDLLNDKDAPVDKGKEVFERLYSRRLKFK